LTKRDVVRKIIGSLRLPRRDEGEGYANTNLALCKYWGKRDEELNLPATSSLSVSLTGFGSRTRVSVREGRDRVELNGKPVPPASAFARRLQDFLDLFRPEPSVGFVVQTENQMPTGAGLASSASGFASLVLALNDLFGWGLTGRELSILARLGSGSASRSVYDGFVIWHAGSSSDGMDSYAEPLSHRWPELRVGVLIVRAETKGIGSREGMRRTARSSPYYTSWLEKCRGDLDLLLGAIASRDFAVLGRVSESNALAMHAAALAAWPPVLYLRGASLGGVQKVWRLRGEGHPVYFSMDAGPNLKLLFLDRLSERIRAEFPGVRIVRPFPD